MENVTDYQLCVIYVFAVFVFLFFSAIILFLRKELISSANKARPLLKKLFETLQINSIENIEFVYESKSRFVTSIKILLIYQKKKKKIGWISIFKRNNADITYTKMDSNLLLVEKILKQNGYNVTVEEYEQSVSFTH